MRAPNQFQQDAIKTTSGPVLIIAGPGSGKTFTLVERIVYLIQTQSVRPESLFVVTFTEKAARELRTRVSNRLTEVGIKFNLNEMYLGTFHSICLRILEENREFTRLKRSFNMLDDFDQKYFIYQRLNDFRAIENSNLIIGHLVGRWGQSETLVTWLNKLSEEALDIESLLLAPDPQIVVLAKCFKRYQELLVESNCLDFSGIQYEALLLLKNQPQILKELQCKFSYLMVDEFQDTNTIQERILSLLMNDQQNLCVVGDDDQGLYRFRGATIRNILEFPEQFVQGRCKQIRLTTNYRSHPRIIEFYNWWMQGQTWEVGEKRFRFDKRIEAEEKAFPDSATVVRLPSPPNLSGIDAWQNEVLTFLKSLKASGKLSDWNQVAFLFRSVRGDRATALARFLENNNIPVYSPRSDMFFEREEIKLMLGAIIFLFPQFPKVRAWADGVHLPIWDYLDNHCFKPFTDELRKPENIKLLNWIKPIAKNHLTLTRNTDYALSGLFYQLLQFPLFSKYLEEDVVNGVDKGRAAHNLATFSKLLAKFEYLHYVNVLSPEYLDKTIRDFFNQFLRFLVDGGIGEYEDEAEFAPKGCVSFLTIHQSKGLEYPIVVCCSLEATPRKQHTEIDELLEAGGYLSKSSFEPLEHTKFF